LVDDFEPFRRFPARSEFHFGPLHQLAPEIGYSLLSSRNRFGEKEPGGIFAMSVPSLSASRFLPWDDFAKRENNRTLERPRHCASARLEPERIKQVIVLGNTERTPPFPSFLVRS
jgi:hypothetical protein